MIFTDLEAKKIAQEWIDHADYLHTLDTREEQLLIAHKVLELLERQRWIPVSERLPEIIGAYLIFDGIEIAWVFFNSDKNWASDNYFYHNVTHWMSLPQPPEQP